MYTSLSWKLHKLLFETHVQNARTRSQLSSVYVSGFEKRGNFTQNANFCHFSTCQHSKPVEALAIVLGL